MALYKDLLQRKTIILMTFLMVFTLAESAGKKCTKTLKRIPVHADFDLNKVSKTLYKMYLKEEKISCY